MKCLRALPATLALLAPLASAAPADESLLAADRSFFAHIASSPPTGLDTLLDEGFAYRTSRGAVIGKTALIGHLDRGLTRIAQTRSWRATRAQGGDTTVVTGVAEILLDEANGSRAVWSRYTHVWVSRQGNWRLLYREANEMAGRLPENELAPELSP